jgi:hypothetical protein
LITPQRRVVGLWVLLGLFVLRVAGQLVVGLFAPAWLPAWHEWYSGLLPYPFLLPAQVLLIAWMVVVNHQNAMGQGRFSVESVRARRWLRSLAALYAGAMLVRYVLTMTLRPEMRWLHGTIPIVFHCVLAAYLALLSMAPSSADR